MYSESDVSMPSFPDVHMYDSSDTCLSRGGGGVYQIIEVDDGLYQFLSSQGFDISTEADSPTNSRVSLDTSVSTDTSLSPDSSPLTNRREKSETFNQSLQESLDALFNSIQPDDDQLEITDVQTLETVTDYCYGDPVGNKPSQTPPPFSDIPVDSTLASHPFFSDLRDTLQTECQPSVVPDNLFETLGNPIHHCQQSALHSNLLNTNDNQMHHVILKEHTLKVRLQKLQEVDFTESVGELSTLFELHVTSIEKERAECLDNQMTAQYKTRLNSYFDHQKNQVIERVTCSLQILEESKKENTRSKPNNRPSWMSAIRQRPTLSQKAIKTMEHWYQSNLHNPYPSATVAEAMALAGNITTNQVKKWFGNKRNRGGNTRSMTEIAKRKHQLRHGVKWQQNQNMIGSLAHYL